MSATAAIDNGIGISGTQWDGIDNSQSLIIVAFKVTPSNSPANYLALGDTLDLTPLIAAGVASGQIPLFVIIESYLSTGASGFVYQYLPGTTIKNGKFQVMTSNGAAPNPLVDLGAGAYPAGVLTDTIKGLAFFVRI